MLLQRTVIQLSGKKNTMRYLNHHILHDAAAPPYGHLLHLICLCRYLNDINFNLAFNKPADASSSEDEHTATNAFDGSMDTRWAIDENDDEYIDVDLGGLHRVEKVVIFWEMASGE